MITRNRTALVQALNKMALKDFHTSDEREQAAAFLKILETNNEKDKVADKPTEKKPRTPKKVETKAEPVVLTPVAGEGLKKAAVVPADEEITL